MLKKLIILGCISATSLFAYNEVSDFVNVDKCNSVVDKKIYKACYSYNVKGALAGWTILDGSKVHEKNIKKRPRFYAEKQIPKKHRVYYSDYTSYGKLFNRGHFITSDADWDFKQEYLNDTYSMVNILPMSAKVNQKTWLKVEKYGRNTAKKLGYLYSVSIADFKGSKKTLKNDVYVPKGFYRVYFNNEENFERCFYYENKLNVNVKADRLKDHLIPCDDVKKIMY